MEKAVLINNKNEKVKDIKLEKSIFDIETNDNVLFDAIILTRANLRQGTHKTKNRSEVSGGGRKPWRQKGTGHARQGSIRAVQWVGGGKYGTPVPRDYSIKQNRKERVLALKTALTHVSNEERLMVIDELKISTPKTKEMISLLETLKIADKKVLIVVDELEENLILASRNLQNVLLIDSTEINVFDLTNADVVLMTNKAKENIEEVLA